MSRPAVGEPIGQRMVRVSRSSWLRLPLRLLTEGAILGVRGYQFAVRPLMIGSCQFCPSCSDYAIIALRRHGLIRGGVLAARRLLRCHPFGPGGIDPVP